MNLHKNKPDGMSDDCVTEKTLRKSIWISVLCAAFCMICLVGATWAWFAVPVTSSTNSFESASFDLTISVKESDTGTVLSASESTESATVYTLDPAETYTVTLTKTGTAKSGFCHIAVTPPDSGIATVYCTEPITDEGGAYTLTVRGFSQIKFTPMWGVAPSSAQPLRNTAIIANAVNTAEAPDITESPTPEDIEPTEPPELTETPTQTEPAQTPESEQTTTATEAQKSEDSE